MDKSSFLSMRVEVPICSFRKGWAREYLETEEIAPPATVFGFLLSLAGEEERENWQGVKIAYARLGIPERSVVLRTIWRVKDTKVPPGSGKNRRPDFQELLTGLSLGIWVHSQPLVPLLRKTLSPISRQSERFGGLSLGESHDLVNDVILDPEISHDIKMEWLVADLKGDQPLPIWVDHVGSRETLWKQFSFQELPWGCPPEDDQRWIEIRAPEACELSSSQKRSSKIKDLKL